MNDIETIKLKNREASTRTIDVTPTWSNILPTLLMILTNAGPVGQAEAKKELQRMAQLADLYAAEHGGK